MFMASLVVVRVEAGRPAEYLGDPQAMPVRNRESQLRVVSRPPNRVSSDWKRLSPVVTMRSRSLGRQVSECWL